jgi:hypothetical protein
MSNVFVVCFMNGDCTHIDSSTFESVLTFKTLNYSPVIDISLILWPYITYLIDVNSVSYVVIPSNGLFMYASRFTIEPLRHMYTLAMLGKYLTISEEEKSNMLIVGLSDLSNFYNRVYF